MKTEDKRTCPRWDAVRKAWYVGPEADREKIANGSRNINQH